MNSFLPLHKCERCDIVLFPNRYASELKIEMRELNDIQTFVYQLEGSNFEQFPFFNWTHGKSSCITCNKEIRQKSFAHHRLYICKKYQKKQKANNSLTLDLITEADFFHKKIYPPFNATAVALTTYVPCGLKTIILIHRELFEIHPCNI